MLVLGCAGKKVTAKRETRTSVEALILIFGELIFAILAPLIAAIVDLIAAVVTFFVSLIWAGRGERQERQEQQEQQEPRKRRASSFAANKVLGVLLVIAVVIVGALFVVNKFYFADSVRMVFGVLERRSGIETACENVDGNLFSGRIALSHCTITRGGHATTDFDLQLDNVEFDLQITSLFGTAEVQTAHVAGLRGSVTRGQASPEDDESVEKPRRSFVIQDLRIENVELSLAGVNKDGGSFELPVRVVSATSAPLRSRLALFDILFRANAAGEIAGAEFEIRTGGDPSGRQTVWRAADVPVASFGAVAGGVLSWFQQGSVDVYVVDTWRRDGQLEIDMDWKLDFRDIEVGAPDTAGVMARLATGPIVDYVNSFGGSFPFEFQLVINESQFEYKSSLAAAGLWTAVGEAVNKVLAGFGIDLGETATETGDKLKEGAKSVLDRLRKPKDEDE